MLPLPDHKQRQLKELKWISELDATHTALSKSMMPDDSILQGWKIKISLIDKTFLTFTSRERTLDLPEELTCTSGRVLLVYPTRAQSRYPQ